jgi:hypothetical protein
MQDERIVSGLQLADPNCGRRERAERYSPVGPSHRCLSFRCRTKLPEQMAGGYTPGWHAYLDRLDQLIAGTDPGSWDELFNAIAPQYMPQ